MTPKEFKIKYPQYSHLEGNELWDKMTTVLLESSNTLTADPNRKITYVTYEINGMEISIEDDNKTIWLTNEGHQCMIIPEKINLESVTESCRFEILDLSKL